MPIRHDGGVSGAVVVSQSTFRILQALYDIRLRLFEIVVASIAAAAGVAALAATTIVRPLVRLRRRADALAQRRGPQPADFPATNRRDEIGALARALQQLTTRLDDQIARLETFAADVAHEFRNPLASISAAADTIGASDSAGERRRFLDMMQRDIQRLDRLVTGTRELARLDGRSSTMPAKRSASASWCGLSVTRRRPGLASWRRQGLARPGDRGKRLTRAIENLCRMPRIRTDRHDDRRLDRDGRRLLPPVGADRGPAFGRRT